MIVDHKATLPQIDLCMRAIYVATIETTKRLLSTAHTRMDAETRRISDNATSCGLREGTVKQRKVNFSVVSTYTYAHAHRGNIFAIHVDTVFTIMYKIQCSVRRIKLTIFSDTHK